MAAPVFTVTCAFAGSSASRDKSQAILSKLAWQESPASGVASTNVAPAPTDTYGQSIFRGHASADCWFSYGKSPNSAGNSRVLVSAGTDIDVFAEAGDSFMWQAA